MIPADVLRALRNDLPIPVTIRYLGRDGPYGKMSEGFFRFVCPYCSEIKATVNPRNNLATSAPLIPGGWPANELSKNKWAF